MSISEKNGAFYPLAFVLAALVLPLAAIMLITFCVMVSVAIPIYEFFQPRADRRQRMNEKHTVLTKVLATPTATRPSPPV